MVWGVASCVSLCVRCFFPASCPCPCLTPALLLPSPVCTAYIWSEQWTGLQQISMLDPLYPARFQSIPSPPLSLFLPFLPLLQAFLILIAARGLLMTHLYHPCLYIASLFAQLDTVPGGDCKLAGIQSLFALNGHVRARFWCWKLAAWSISSLPNSFTIGCVNIFCSAVEQLLVLLYQCEQVSMQLWKNNPGRSRRWNSVNTGPWLLWGTVLCRARPADIFQNHVVHGWYNFQR